VINHDDEIIVGIKGIADVLKMHPETLKEKLRKYPFNIKGSNGRVDGSWRVPKSYVLEWWTYVMKQDRRHPEARHMRPEEAPELQDIKGR